jgi:transposase-like protein
MSDDEVFRTCPYCASQEVPTLLVKATWKTGSDSSWRCRACGREWSDAQSRLLRAS